jgi:hypothetical protein
MFEEEEERQKSPKGLLSLERGRNSGLDWEGADSRALQLLFPSSISTTPNPFGL